MAYRGLWAFFKFSWTRKVFFKALYEVLPRMNGKGDWQFMNYGYSPTEKEESNNKKPLKNKLQQHPLNMYHYLACCAPIEKLNLLEVGSGRGGGANYIANNFQPNSIIGLDFSTSAIKLAKSIFNSPNLSYVEGNAMSLDFKSNHFDVIINVESCHAYANQSKFLNEVLRVLKPGGKLLLVDFRKNHLWPDFEKAMNALSFKVEEEDISGNVLKALKEESSLKKSETNLQLSSFNNFSFKFSSEFLH